MNLLKSWTVPIETVSEGNLFEHWTKSSARHKHHKKFIRDNLSEISCFRDIPITIKFIRISPRFLDADENLRMAFKWIKDQISELIYPEKTIVDPESIKRAQEKNLELIKDGKKPKRIIRKISGRADDTNMIKWDYGQEKGKPKEKGMRVEVYETNSSA